LLMGKIYNNVRLQCFKENLNGTPTIFTG